MPAASFPGGAVPAALTVLAHVLGNLPAEAWVLFALSGVLGAVAAARELRELELRRELHAAQVRASQAQRTDRTPDATDGPDAEPVARGPDADALCSTVLSTTRREVSTHSGSKHSLRE